MSIEEEMLSSDIKTLRKMRHMGKDYLAIYKKDSFWKKYYMKYVDSKYVIFPEYEKKGKWEMAVMLNYSEIVKVNTKDLRQNDLWSIRCIREDFEKRKDSGREWLKETWKKECQGEFYGNFMCIKIEDDVQICVFVHDPTLFDKKPGNVYRYRLKPFLVDEIPEVGAEGILSSLDGKYTKILPYQTELEVVMYPYNKNLTLRIDTEQVPMRTRDKYEDEDEKELDVYTMSKRRVFLDYITPGYSSIVENGVWVFYSGTPQCLNFDHPIINNDVVMAKK